MHSDFIISGLDYDLFSKYFEMTESELKSIGAYIFLSDECPCYPCRVSLEDAEVGDRVLAIAYDHHSANSPYSSSGPVFIRKNTQVATLEKNTIPVMLRHRLLSIRGYNDAALMIEADTIAGKDLESVLYSQFANKSVEYIHIHNASPGCFNCSVNRT